MNYLSFTAISAWVTCISMAAAQELNPQQIQLIRDTASSICDTVRGASGVKNDVQLQVDVKGQLNGLIGKVIDVGGAGKGSISREDFEGLSRDATASALEGDRGCRERVFNKMFDKLGSANMAPRTSVAEPIKKIVCTGAYERNCPGVHDIFYECGYFGPDEVIAQNVCRGIKIGAVRLKTVSGNRCGYALIEVTCPAQP
jgi:hypothetical protein